MEQLPSSRQQSGIVQRNQNEIPLTALVKSVISSVRSQSVSRTTTPEISQRSLALRKSYNIIQITEAYNPDIQVHVAAVNDVYLLYNQKETPTLRMLEQAYGQEYASRVWIKTQLVILNDFVGVKNKLEDFQINPLCDQILVEYGGLNLLEFCLFMARLRSGKYEQFYGSVDPMLILKSLEEFMDDRREDININVAEQERKERERKDAEAEAYRKAMIESYRKRIPNSDTDKAPVDFPEYNWGCLYKLTDDELKVALVKVAEMRKEAGKNKSDKPSGVVGNIASTISTALGFKSSKSSFNPFGIISDIRNYVEEVIKSRSEIIPAQSKS